jgi:nicotinamidase-related amidase
MQDFEDHCWRDVMPPDAYEIYAAYQRETGVKGKPALVAVDLFACVFPDEELPVIEAMKKNPRSCGEFAFRAVEPIKQVLEAFRESALPVIFTTSARSAGKSATNRGGRGAAEDFVIHPTFARRDHEVLVYKDRASCFFGTDLKSVLDSHGVDTVVLCGETTSGCVRATAVDAYSHGYHVVLAEEAVFDRGILNHQVALFDLHHKYADVIGVEAVADQVRRHAHEQ